MINKNRQTWRLAQPLRSHWGKATCADIDCAAYLNGWKTVVPSISDHADLIRTDVKRMGWHYTEKRMGDGLVEFTFPAGQKCFKYQQHRMALDREPVASRHLPGRSPIVYERGTHFNEEFNEEMYQIDVQRSKG